MPTLWGTKFKEPEEIDGLRWEFSPPLKVHLFSPLDGRRPAGVPSLSLDSVILFWKS